MRTIQDAKNKITLLVGCMISRKQNSKPFDAVDRWVPIQPLQ